MTQPTLFEAPPQKSPAPRIDARFHAWWAKRRDLDRELIAGGTWPCGTGAYYRRNKPDGFRCDDPAAITCVKCAIMLCADCWRWSGHNDCRPPVAAPPPGADTIRGDD